MWTSRRSRPGRRSAPAACRRAGFTLLEVLVALAVLSVALVALHKAFSSTIYVNEVSEGLWKAMLHAENEMARWQRRPTPQVSVQQGEYPADHPLAGYTWKREVVDEEPFPGVTVRKLVLELSWRVGGTPQTYRTSVYVSPSQ